MYVTSVGSAISTLVDKSYKWVDALVILALINFRGILRGLMEMLYVKITDELRNVSLSVRI
jgi:hypothetical protein